MMIAKVTRDRKEYTVDFMKPIDISLPLHTGADCVSAWYVNPMKIEPVCAGDWVGEVNRGGSVNFRNIIFNPHGNGTHTECVGHISREDFSINQCLKRFMFFAELVTILPTEMENRDSIVTEESLKTALGKTKPESVIIRTLPNDVSKISRQYSGTNPVYISKDAILYLNSLGVEHLLFDMPSIDKEKDQGVLSAHHAFWKYPAHTQKQKTVTELVYVPDSIPDGSYLLNLQIASFENDASPSKPLIYKMIDKSK